MRMILIYFAGIYQYEVNHDPANDLAMMYVGYGNPRNDVWLQPGMGEPRRAEGKDIRRMWGDDTRFRIVQVEGDTL